VQIAFVVQRRVHTLIGNPILRAFQATALMAQFFYSVIMAIYVLYLTRELGLSASSVGLIFGLGGGVGVLVGSAAAANVARLFGLGRTLVLAHLLFGVSGFSWHSRWCGVHMPRCWYLRASSHSLGSTRCTWSIARAWSKP